MSKTIAIPFSWNVICQICRKKVKSEEIKKDWRGLLVCSDDFETRHPLDAPVKRQGEDTSVPFTSSEPIDEYITVTKHALADATGLPVGTFDTNNKTI